MCASGWPASSGCPVVRLSVARFALLYPNDNKHLSQLSTPLSTFLFGPVGPTPPHSFSGSHGAIADSRPPLPVALTVGFEALRAPPTLGARPGLVVAVAGAVVAMGADNDHGGVLVGVVGAPRVRGGG
jgi:hypothetical protein